MSQHQDRKLAPCADIHRPVQESDNSRCNYTTLSQIKMRHTEANGLREYIRISVKKISDTVHSTAASCQRQGMQNTLLFEELPPDLPESVLVGEAQQALLRCLAASTHPRPCSGHVNVSSREMLPEQARDTSWLI
jgi:hypothetical protein